jgi:lipopolysaccharide export system permease protein
MIRHWTLNRYLAAQYTQWLAVILSALTGIVYMFNVAELMRRAADHRDTGFYLILKMGIYKVPDTIEQILPFAVLFAGMLTFWRLTRSQELIVARAAGVSAWQFLAPALMVTLAFSFFNMTLLNPIGSVFNSRYKELDMHFLQHSPTLDLTGAGLWLRQSDSDRRYLIHADHVSMTPLTMTPMFGLIYDKDDHYLGRMDATKATLNDGYWDIENVWFNWDQQPPQHQDNYKLPTNLTFNRIQESMSPPNTISFWELPRFIRALKAIGLPQARHELAFQSLLAQPVLQGSMVFFAAIFSLRMSRRGNVTLLVASGASLGVGIFVLNGIVRAFGANQAIPATLAAWAIPLVALLLSNTVLLNLEDS